MSPVNARALAWALADGAARHLAAEQRLDLNIKIGAAEYDVAIIQLLTHYECMGLKIVSDVLSSANSWALGYVGSPAEAHLRGILNRISVTAD